MVHGDWVDRPKRLTHFTVFIEQDFLSSISLVLRFGTELHKKHICIHNIIIETTCPL